MAGTTNSSIVRAAGLIDCDGDGDFSYSNVASGSGTFDVTLAEYTAVKVA
jgi:hypothetical protein